MLARQFPDNHRDIDLIAEEIKKVMGYMELDEKIDGEQAFAFINAGEPNALKALKKYTDDLAITIFSINVLLDVEKTVIGGGISQQPILL